MEQTKSLMEQNDIYVMDVTVVTVAVKETHLTFDKIVYWKD